MMDEKDLLPLQDEPVDDEPLVGQISMEELIAELRI